jgi:hypothetical protein
MLYSFKKLASCSLFVIATFVATAGFVACAMPNDPSTAPSTSPGTTGDFIKPAEGVDIHFISPLPDTELVTVTNSGANAVDLVLYAGAYSDTDSNRITKKSWAVAKGATNVTIKAADLDRLNLWFVPQSGPDKDTVTRFTDNGNLIVLKLGAGNNWTLMLDGSTPWYTWNLVGTDKTTGYDWTIDTIRDDRTVSALHKEYGGVVVAPAIRLVNSADWSVDGDGVHLEDQESGTGSHDWMYGTLRFKYNGTAPLKSVRAFIRMRTADNSKRYFECAFAEASTIKSNGYESNSAVLAAGELARFPLLENLLERGMTMSDIQAMDIMISGDALADGSYTVPGGLALGSHAWDTPNANGHVDLTNNTAAPVTPYLSGAVFFADSAGLEYTWTYWILNRYDSQSARWQYSTDPVAAGETVRLAYSVNRNPSLTDSLTPVSLSQTWTGRALHPRGPAATPPAADPIERTNADQAALRAAIAAERAFAANTGARHPFQPANVERDGR